MEKRAYFFTHVYMNSIQHGIQPQHVTAELFIKYDSPFMDFKRTSLKIWAKNHKTTIVLNGGMSGDLKKILTHMNRVDNPHPYTSFNESEYAMEGMLTCIGVILPEKIYGHEKAAYQASVASTKLGPEWALTDWEEDMVSILSGKQLAK